MSETPIEPGADWCFFLLKFRGLPRDAWGWEFLRRNRGFHACLARTLSACEQILADDRLRAFKVHADAGGNGGECLIANSADRDACSATVVWNPLCCSAVLRAIAAPASACPGAKVFRVRESPLPASLYLFLDGSQHLVVQDGPRRVQLAVTGASLLDPVALVADTAVEPEIAEQQSRALAAFRDFRATGHMLDKHFPPAPRAEKLWSQLQALDGWMAGASRVKSRLHSTARKPWIAIGAIPTKTCATASAMPLPAAVRSWRGATRASCVSRGQLSNRRSR